ncbi:MAG: hypothetical protein PSV22_22055 [Pseudolabrys sp.]|nr:hypothetical protein [Pseudolabrys sp.]
MRRKLFHLVALITFVGCAAFVAQSSHAQTASAAPRPIDYQKSGIRFQIKASIKAAPGSPYVKHDDDKSAASLDVKLRISAHATESNYFGVNTETFPAFRLTEGSVERLFWQDAACHQRRGLPKVTVTAIDGSMQTENGRVDVAARPRRIGKLVPADEISAGRRLPGGADKIGPFIAFSSQTNASHLVVHVKVYTFDCPLKDAAP